MKHLLWIKRMERSPFEWRSNTFDCMLVFSQSSAVDTEYAEMTNYVIFRTMDLLVLIIMLTLIFLCMGTCCDVTHLMVSCTLLLSLAAQSHPLPSRHPCICRQLQQLCSTPVAGRQPSLCIWHFFQTIMFMKKDQHRNPSCRTILFMVERKPKTEKSQAF